MLRRSAGGEFSHATAPAREGMGPSAGKPAAAPLGAIIMAPPALLSAPVPAPCADIIMPPLASPPLSSPLGMPRGYHIRGMEFLQQRLLDGVGAVEGQLRQDGGVPPHRDHEHGSEDQDTQTAPHPFAGTQ